MGRPDERERAKHQAEAALDRLEEALDKGEEVDRLSHVLGTHKRDHFAELIEQALTGRRKRA